MRLENQVALVTGAAAGMGKATAIALAREGADVCVNYSRSEAEAKDTAAAIEALGRRALLYKADVADEKQDIAMVESVVSQLGRLDILVNNAGTTTFVDFANLDGVTDEIWNRTFDVNLKGVFYCSRAASKTMVKKQSGCIVNVASVAGLRPGGSSIPYAASKAAVISLTGSLAIALSPYVRVNAVAPGFIETRWHAGRDAAAAKARGNALLKRNGTPENVAEVILSLVTSASFVTGQTIAIDGGRFPA